MSRDSYSRRQLLCAAAQIGAGVYIGGAESFASEPEGRISADFGCAAGDINQHSTILWSRCDRPGRMRVQLSQDPSFAKTQEILGPTALASSDFTAKLLLNDLSPGTQYHYRVSFEDLTAKSVVVSEPNEGTFKTAPADNRDVTFLWSGDTAGQGYGIDEARGGMLTYKTMLGHSPDFFVHSGDTCYSDNPFPKSVQLDDGSTWNNIVTPETSKVAETIDEFRANQRYNLLDKNVREFNLNVPMYAQWDDHETTNNWYPGEWLSDDRYSVKNASLLAARAKQAFNEYMPIRQAADNRKPIHRVVHYGPLLDLFFLDLRSFRGANSSNRSKTLGPESSYMGTTQLEWLKRELKSSQATWKVICSDMPIGMIVGDGQYFENCANGDGPPLGRELEIASLLKFMKQNGIRNTVWLTADVHYAASHYYDPNSAVFRGFDPFWEFVSGPLHAGTFGPSKMDNTFGPQVRFKSIPDDMKPNRPPSEGLQFFGKVKIDGESKTMIVQHFDRAGDSLWQIELKAK